MLTFQAARAKVARKFLNQKPKEGLGDLVPQRVRAAPAHKEESLSMQLPSRNEVLDGLPGLGLQLAAVLPIHYPRALLRACGFHPMEVWGPASVDPSEGNFHFQAYTCGIVRNATSFLLQGRLDAAKVLLIPHTCDALQGMASVLKDFVATPQPVTTLYLPRGLHHSNREFLVDELRQLAAKLSELSGVVPDAAALNAQIELDEEADSLLAHLASSRARYDLSDKDFYALARCREYVLSETFIELVNAAPRLDQDLRRRGVPLMLSGIVPEPMSLFEQLADAGAHVVCDDLACISRRLYPKSDPKANPFQRLAERLLAAPHDPTRGAPIMERAHRVYETLTKAGAKGLVIYDPKFCEPELFDIPLLTQFLGSKGVPVLHVEFDMSEAVSNQFLTRLEAFAEMLA